MGESSPPVELAGRDLAIVQLVARFKQLASAHIHELLFSDLSTRTPTDRSLRRLVERDFLVRIERRIVGGSRGGSGQYVYALGRRGFFMHFEGGYRPTRVVNYHSLAIADCYVTLRRLEQAGQLRLHGVTTEPDCWVRIGNYELAPDLFADLERDGERLKLLFEVDMATESQARIKEKLVRYWRAYDAADASEWPIFPQVLFVAVDAERDKELRWLIEQGVPEAQPLFAVTTRHGLAELLIHSP